MLRQTNQQPITALYPRLSHEDELQGESSIVEAMKLMNEIESEFDGEIAEIYVANGEAVEYGQSLFRIV